MKILAAILLATTATVPALAGPIVYSIQFYYTSAPLVWTSPGLDAPSGSFTYDPDDPGAGISNFIVDWGSATFDLTTSANNPSLAFNPTPLCSPAVAG